MLTFFFISFPNTSIIFEKGEGSSINLTGSAKGKVVRQSIINPDWDFSKMGIGGLDTQFNAIFRRAFASRVFPPEIMEQLGCKHVKGILLFGPPGTGKTLMARQIGQMLNAREPKIVNGPQILDKYVGESGECTHIITKARTINSYLYFQRLTFESSLLRPKRRRRGWAPTPDCTSSFSMRLMPSVKQGMPFKYIWHHEL